MPITAGFTMDPSETFGGLLFNGEYVAKFDAAGLYGCLPSTSYADDAAAAAAGIKVGGLYHTSGTVKVRLT